MNGLAWTWAAAMARCLGLSATLPPFGGDLVSWRQRGALAVILSLSLVAGGALSPAAEGGPVLLLGEALLGALMGFVVRCILEGARAFGAFLGVQAGLGQAAAGDLLGGGRSAPMAQFALATAFLAFLACDGHHLVVSALVGSFRALPPGMLLAADRPLATGLVEVLGRSMASGLWLAMPLVALLVLGEGVFALMQRAAPGLAGNGLATPLRLLALHGLLLLALGLLLPWQARCIHDGLDRLQTRAEVLVQRGG